MNLVDKLYDNVPLKAEGLAIVDNRVMMSNYVEGRANVDLKTSTLDVVYAAAGEAASGGLIGTSASSVVASSGTLILILTLLPLLPLRRGIQFQLVVGFISFFLKPTFTATAASGNLISINAVENPGGDQTVGSLTATSVAFTPAPTNPDVYSFSYRTPEDFTTTEFANQVRD